MTRAPVLLLVCCAALSGGTDFQRQVRPILADACFHCHGPDSKTRMAGLRLDTREGACTPRPNGAAVVPGQPDRSLLIARITADNPARRMPPPQAHKTLTPAQVETLKRWIGEGAPWKEHWSFTAPVRPPPPPGKAANPIDRFVQARLREAGLEPAPPADRRHLVRRLAFDLTGLPPDPEDVEAFAADKTPNAYERLVDRYLASPRWGEHRARYWLDAARYGDTHGIHVDNYREMWPYRDWVIRAFNANMPFDRFTIEQLAGDLLPERTLEQQIASGFQRCNVTTNEAGDIVEEIEAMYAKDRVDTAGAVWLGLTIGCATCHDHKFDPLTQRDFYSLTAFFRNTTQNAMDGNVPDTPPVIVVPRDADRPRWAGIRRQDAELRTRMAERRAAADPAFDAWLASPERHAPATPLGAAAETLAVFSKPLPEADGVTLAEGSAPGRKALHFGKEKSLELPNVPLDADQPFSIAVSFFFPKGEDGFVLASQSDAKDKGRGWVIEISARVAAMRLTGEDGKTIQVRAGHLEQLKPDTWNHFVFTYDGSREQSGLGMFWNGRSIPTQGGGDQNTTLPGAICSSGPLRLGNQGKRYFEDGRIDDFRIFNRALTEEEAHLVSAWTAIEATAGKTELGSEERDALRLYWANHRDGEYREMAAKLQSLAAERREIRRRGAVTHVMEEKPTPAFAHILYRGMYDAPRDRVEPGVPAVLPPMAASLPRNRLGLATWLVDASNPLTARVTVNRFWQEVFGTGIVKTSEDFGSQGEAPSHPELLDWLAVEFRESGWDVKRLFKLIVTSAAYRQSAAATPAKLEKDPQNRLLSRGPRFRMDGEMVRDCALAASALLTPSIGGPSVKPYQPGGVWETVAMLGSNTRFYQRDSGERLYRRSLYTFWKRAAPPASMDIFNAPTRETCTVRRERTNTPLQALVTMNDVQFVEAARALAEGAMRESGGDADRQIDFMTRRLMARTFDARERDITRRARQDYLAWYGAHPEDAARLLAAGESKRDERLPAAEFAAMTMVANQLLNLDEVLNK